MLKLITNRWILKAATQKGLSVLPGGEVMNAFLQSHVTKSLELDEVHFSETLRQCRRHLENFFSVRGNCEPGFTVFEVGTGWYPIISVGLYLCGAAKVTTLDIRPLATLDRIREIFQFFSQSASDGSLLRILPWANETRIRVLQTLARRPDLPALKETLGTIGIDPILGDARQVDLETGSIDFIFSNTTLQVIPSDLLPGFFAEFRRLASPQAVMCHHMGLGDGYALIDPSITWFNFLRYSNRAWKLIDNSLVHNNRLRVSDYRGLHQESGWLIGAEDTTYGCVDDLEKVPLAKEFQAYSTKDLLALRTWLVSTCI